nr:MULTISPECIES: FAD-binding protein [unclassified Bradyrhizobium]
MGNRLSIARSAIRPSEKIQILDQSKTDHLSRCRSFRQRLARRPDWRRTYGSVLDAQGNAIQGLYACGNDMTSPMRGIYPGAGITIGPAIVFAYRTVNAIVLSADQEQKAVASRG